MCYEYNNNNLLLRLLTAVLATFILLHIWDTPCHNMAACTWWPQIENLVTSLHLIY